MPTVKIGFIGCGNMGGALARAVSKSAYNKEILLCDKSLEKVELISKELNCSYCEIDILARDAKYIFLGVKPQMMRETLESIVSILKNRKDRFILVTMAAGVKISLIQSILEMECPVIRIMPNTPVSAGEGMIVYSASENILNDEINEFTEALKFAGRLDYIDEQLIDAACAISGCGPAFVYMFADALSAAGEQCGLDRSKATEYAAQTLKGAAQLLLTSGKLPNILIDEVCSPGGSTIEGVKTLKNNSFDKTVMEAVNASFNRTKELGK